jgi:HlyD family secretion protein
MIRKISCCLFAALALSGCHKRSAHTASPVSDKPAVRLVRPEVRELVRSVGQPSFIDSYEQTAIYAKLPAYVQKWNVDIGDRVKKDALLATLYIPELEQECRLKQAQVEMDESLVSQAKELVAVAEGNLQAAIAKVAETKADVGKFEALVKRWDSEVERQKTMVADRVIDRQILGESQRQWESSKASKDAAEAAVKTAEANQLARTADLGKAKVDIDVALARLKVARADEQRVEALYSYTQLKAPYEGIVVLRNTNTGDFVLPATGDPSASNRAPDQSSARATPIYVLARTDIVRVYVDVPESQANYIVSDVDKKAGDKRPVTKATVRVSAFQDADLPATVTRSSWALNMKSRTLRAEIDLPNPDAKLLPGMYAYGKVLIERPATRVLPEAAVVEIGNESCCYLYEHGKAVKTPLQVGLSSDGWVEVLKKKVGHDWTDFTGDESVISGDLSELTDGCEVTTTDGKI